jgi:hypothetical protein
MRTTQALEEGPTRSCIRRSVLATSLAGNPVDLLVITAPTDKQEVLKKRKGVVLTGEGQ